MVTLNKDSALSTILRLILTKLFGSYLKAPCISFKVSYLIGTSYELTCSNSKTYQPGFK